MLTLEIPGEEKFDEKNETFYTVGSGTIRLEHSLVSLSKWEEKWHVPFFSKDNDKTIEQTIDYIRCMTITQNVPDDFYRSLTNENIKAVQNYIDDPHTATWFSDTKRPAKQTTINKEQITAELIYYWMIALNIPFECQKWHLNKLLTLIRVCSVKNSANDKSNKMTGKELARHNSDLNAQRRAMYHSKG
jgi:hypothetical protein